VLAVPLVGVGIAISPLLEVVAAFLLVVACLGLALIQMRVAVSKRQPTVSTLLLMSGISLLAGMILAAIYAVGEYREDRLLEIEQMIPLHGAANAWGFALCGLLAWFVCRPTASSAVSPCARKVG
jgi:hypothetical protein